MQNQYRAFGQTNDFLCHASDQGAANAVVAVAADDNQVGLTPGR